MAGALPWMDTGSLEGQAKEMGIALYVREQLECTELSLGMDDAWDG